MANVLEEIHSDDHLKEHTVTELLAFAEHLEYGELHFKRDPATGLQAIVALHNTKLGPALGGCRCIEYDNPFAAFRDAMRLAHAMGYKAALANLPIGGGKAVLMRPKSITDRHAYFKAFGRFVNDLGGRYITAMDSGTTEDDMNIIATETSYIASHSAEDGTSGDPSPATALGTKIGIDACVQYKLNKENCKDLHVVLQGVGNVGYEIARLLHADGAKLTVADVVPGNVKRCVDEFQANVVDVNEVYNIPCDVFAPCALGAVVNDDTLPQLQTGIIAGCANNVLKRLHHGEDLRERGILLAPDYVINAGGLIYATAHYHQQDDSLTQKQIQRIPKRLFEIFERADREQCSTMTIANAIGHEILSDA